MFISTIFGFLVTFSALAGTEISGGGNAVVCFGESGTIQSAQLLDLYEGQAKYGLVAKPSSEGVESQLKKALLAFSHGLSRDGILVLQGKNILQGLKFLPPGVGLKPVEDSNHLVLPKACRVIQLARYEANDEIFVDTEIWEHLDSTNRAALVAHETLYWYLRQLGETNSDRARKAVALAFAGQAFPALDHGLPEANEMCSTVSDDEHLPWAAFATYAGIDGKRILQFEHLNGYFMLSKSTGSVLSATSFKDSNEEWLSFFKLESLVDGGLNVFITLTPGKSGTGKIGVGNGVGMPVWHEFTCK